MNKDNVLNNLFNIIEDRKDKPIEGSYTGYLFEKGLDKILKKVGEESSEVIIAAKNEDKEELIKEICDLTYHIMVLMAEKQIKLDGIEKELEKEEKKYAIKK
ncbi:phosphoribosyl-ATP diphosphatase [Clostridium botulinum]|nr:phosphoribosyl-ATP diphosphatase [Clostridium botulinum]MBO0530726.1 phosphoribosyl-ATP diphosphatase [Clostridium botulinum]